MVSACRKKPEPQAAPVKEAVPVTVATDADPNAAPPPPPPVPSGNDLGSGSKIDLVALNKIFKSYCATLDTGKPRSLGELVAAGYMDKLPEPPKGKRLAIDFKKMEVVLEND
jgi:hypothetical protein